MAAPYREPQVPGAPPARAPDVDPEITTPDGHRARAILVDAEDLASGGERALEHQALVRCDACEGVGCSVCGECGASLQKSKVVARWDAGMTDGDAVSLEGRGDAPGLRRDAVRRAVPGGRGDLLVRVGTKKKAVRAIENANRRRRRRQRLYLDMRAAARVRQRTVRRRVLLMFAAMVFGLGGLTVVTYFRMGAYGESCTKGRDCRSGLCAESTGFILGKGGFTEKRCTQRCRADADCAGGAKCNEIELDDSFGVPTGKRVRACGRN